MISARPLAFPIRTQVHTDAFLRARLSSASRVELCLVAIEKRTYGVENFLAEESKRFSHLAAIEIGGTKILSRDGF